MVQKDETILLNSLGKQQEKDGDKVTGMSPMWKTVTLGGVMGIMLGASAMYAVDVMAGNAETDDVSDANAAHHPLVEKPQVAEVEDSMSFKDAFNAARAEVGKGGVFHWRGHIYNTYTESEWKEMTDVQKHDFAQAVKPEARPEELDMSTVHENVAGHENIVAHENVGANPSASASDVHTVASSSSSGASATSSASPDSSEADVHLVSSGEVQLADGSTATVGVYDIGGHMANVWDVDQDGTPDIAVVDVNDNGQIDEGEVIDLHTGGVISTDVPSFAGNENTHDDGMNLQQASLENPDVAPDMPDYMPDADAPMA